MTTDPGGIGDTVATDNPRVAALGLVRGTVAPFAGTADELGDLLWSVGPEGCRVTLRRPPLPTGLSWIVAQTGRYLTGVGRGNGCTVWCEAGESATAADWLRATCRSTDPSVVVVEQPAADLTDLGLDELAIEHALAVVTVA